MLACLFVVVFISNQTIVVLVYVIVAFGPHLRLYLFPPPVFLFCLWAVSVSLFRVMNEEEEFRIKAEVECICSVWSTFSEEYGGSSHISKHWTPCAADAHERKKSQAVVVGCQEVLLFKQPTMRFIASKVVPYSVALKIIAVAALPFRIKKNFQKSITLTVFYRLTFIDSDRLAQVVRWVWWRCTFTSWDAK